MLFVSEGNAARSIMAEALLKRLGSRTFQVFSAGRKPADHLNAHTLETLKQAGYDTSELRPKSWDMFVTPSAPTLHVVVTLDDAMKKGPFPIWYCNPMHVHWPFADPQAVAGGDAERKGAHRRLYGDMEQQILKLLGLDLTGLNDYALKAKLSFIAPKG
ncbi:MAG TPA: arsenate reductase ArsC [Magnetovibrio sp.]